MVIIKNLVKIYVALALAATNVSAIWPNQPSPLPHTLIANGTATATPTPTWYFYGKAMPPNNDTEPQCAGSADVPRDGEGLCVGPDGQKYPSLWPTYSTNINSKAALASVSLGGVLAGVLFFALLAL
ncbi:hypothetical protein LTR91_009289 [Friedmanniomyces endolithicus]|uniref:Uncharacterized protein n=1 Tax=Friedmanniomyces endolithicus TaxID=329885 RepID=A0A4U0V5I0_9PEZI|nr:hypothetical protein LTS09_015255 [Friedmanniomyces endolithicus]KAK0355670.1 hypothetical protein LTR94_007553 [Friedmanniomyces endolithicus]KAK0768587.1 hypothetical protein LTR59_017561 [Friedmanniomyces endolithicus]KAK0775449.1 hypothetical protein LTR75_016577 [Friedmanniomyces endolithicus]KAK0812327.1 hypothetical protein LTR38_003349 [Friedmanniomyces endolithicus]